MLLDSKRLLTLIVFSCAALPSYAVDQAEPTQKTQALQATQPVPQPATCKRPTYPARALRAEEEGISVLGYKVRPDGTVASSIVLNSSGSPDLDQAAETSLSHCRFTRAAGEHAAADLWTRVTYVWQLADAPDLLRAKRAAALATSKGSLPARYHLGLILAKTAQTDADRQKALVVLQSAAELGHAHAQFDLGQRFEKGDGIEVNLDEAMRWYRESAEQGDPLAAQRLALGIMPH